MSTIHSKLSRADPQSPDTDLKPTANDPQLTSNSPLGIDLQQSGSDSKLIPNSQTLSDPPSHPGIGQTLPTGSGEGAIDLQPIVVDEEAQTTYDNITLIPEAIQAQIPPEADTITSLLNSSSFTPTLADTIGLLPVKSCLLEDRVQWTTDCILEALVPTQSWVSDLELEIKA